jgi:bacterioferritin
MNPQALRGLTRAVLALLNDVLTGELTAINQYFLHARLCHHWAYERLHERVRKESVGEMKHADELIERTLYLEGVPNLQRLGKVSVGQTVPEQFQLDVALEMEAVKRLNDGIELCRSVGDSGSRDLLEKILGDGEQHIDWIETQQEAIKQIGQQGYLAEQLRS